MNHNDPIIRNLRIIYCKTFSTLEGFKDVITGVGNSKLELPVRQRFNNWEEVQALLYMECMKHYPDVFDNSDPRVDNCPDWYDFAKMLDFSSEKNFHIALTEGDKKALYGFEYLFDKEDFPEVLNETLVKCVKILNHTQKFTLGV